MASSSDVRTDGRPEADGRSLQAQYAAWFRCMSWNWYVTLTFDREVSRGQAWNLLEQFLNEVERYGRCSVSALAVLEAKWSGLGKPSSGHHFHMLLRAPQQISAKYLSEVWQGKRYGGARCSCGGSKECQWGEGGAIHVCPYDAGRAAAAYLFKEVQDNPDDWYLHRPPSAGHKAGELA